MRSGAVRRRWFFVGLALVLLATFVYLNNTSRFGAPRAGGPTLLAHRGVAALGQLPAGRRGELMVYGGDRPASELRRVLPDLKVMSRESLRGCLLRYIAYGWTGVVPGSCARTVVLLPSNLAPWLWG